MTNINKLKVEIAAALAQTPTIALCRIYKRLKEVTANETGEFDLVTVENAHIHLDLLNRELKLRRQPRYNSPLSKMKLALIPLDRVWVVKQRTPRNSDNDEIGGIGYSNPVGALGEWAIVWRSWGQIHYVFRDTFSDAIAATGDAKNDIRAYMRGLSK